MTADADTVTVYAAYDADWHLCVTHPREGDIEVCIGGTGRALCPEDAADALASADLYPLRDWEPAADVYYYSWSVTAAWRPAGAG